MADRTIDVVTADKPWVLITQHAILGNLDGVLDITGEYGLASGEDLSDEELPNLVFSDATSRIQFRGAAEGCLTFNEDASSGIHAPTDDALDISVRGTRLLRLDADEGLSIWTETGQSFLAIRRHGNAYSTGADIHANSILGLSATESVGVFLDTDSNTDARAVFSVRTDADNWVDARAIFYAREDSRVGLRYPGVQHGAEDTHVAYTDTILEFLNDKDVSTEPGGGVLIGLKDAQVAAGEEGGCLQLRGYLEEDVMTGKNTTARSLVEVYGAQTSAGALENVTANGNVFSVRAYVSGAWTNCIIVDEDGDLYYRGALVAFDEHDDARAISDLYHIMTGNAEATVRYDRAALEDMGVLSGDGDGIFLSRKGATALQFGAIRQINERQKTVIGAANETRETILALTARIEKLEA